MNLQNNGTITWEDMHEMTRIIQDGTEYNKMLTFWMQILNSEICSSLFTKLTK